MLFMIYYHLWQLIQQSSYIAFGWALEKELCLWPRFFLVATVKTVNGSLIIPIRKV